MKNYKMIKNVESLFLQLVKEKPFLFWFLTPTKLHARSIFTFSSPSVSTVDGPQAATVFPVCWLIFRDPPPLDVASPSSHCSWWFVVFQALNRMHFLIRSDFLKAIFQQSGCFLQVRWVNFCHYQQKGPEHMFSIRNIYCLATYENMLWWKIMLLNKGCNYLRNLFNDSLVYAQVFFCMQMNIFIYWIFFLLVPALRHT